MNVSNVKWRQSEICIVNNNKPQGSIAKHLKCDESLYCTFIIQSAGEKIFKIGEHLPMPKLQTEWLIVSYAPFPLSSKMLISPDELNNLCIQTETVSNGCYVNRPISVSLLSTYIKLLL